MPDELLPVHIAAEVAGSVIPGAGPVAARMLHAVAREWTTNRSVTMAAAARTSGLSPEDLADRIIENPELVPLVTRVLHYAALTGRHKKLEGLGAVFGAAATDPHLVDTLESVLLGLDSLRDDDVAVLRDCREKPTFHGSSAGTRPAHIRTTRSVASRLNTSQTRVEASLARLAAAGFMRTSSAYGGTLTRISEEGRLLFDVLERLGSDLT